jgi:hypothetical protein
MQLFMAFHSANIKAIEQPIYLLAIERHQLFFTLRPNEFIFLKAFVIQHKAVVFPKQALNLIATLIGEDIKMAVKRIVA